jgi:prophage regulatory protein
MEKQETSKTSQLRRVIPEKTVVDVTGLDRVTIWRRERAGDFPKRIQLSPNRVGFFEDEIAAWLDERAAARRE